METIKSKVLIIGATGYIGKWLVKASLEQGHETYVLQRPEAGFDNVEKNEILFSFKKCGARLITGSYNDHDSLVRAMKLVDVVICAISGVHVGNQILLQLKLVDAIKEAGNIKRFLPSEFGTDPSRMMDAMEPGRATFKEKMVVRKAIEDAGIPFTYVSSNCFAGYFVGGLCQYGHNLPSTDSVVLYGDGNHKSIFVYEEDIAAYTIKSVDDPRTLNKTLYLRPSANILSQRELVEIWEKLIGKQLHKSCLPKQEFLNIIKEKEYAEQASMSYYYHFFYQGCLANFEIGNGAEEASSLYPDIKYTKMKDYLKRYL